MKKILKAVTIVVCSLLAAVLLVGAFIFYAPEIFETHDNTPVEGSQTWMEDLSDDLCISAVNMPGAHDAGADYAMLSWFSKCQCADIVQLLKDGIRYIDVRLRVEGDELVFCHGFCDCYTGSWPFGKALSFGDFVASCYTFLETHPSEFLVFNVKKEAGDESIEEFQTLLNAYVTARPDKWYLSGSTLPSVGEARGQIILLRRFEDRLGLNDRAGLYVEWNDQGNRDNQDQNWAQTDLNLHDEDGDAVIVFVQDRYKYNTAEKWPAFMAGIEKRPTPEGVGDCSFLLINFLSTNGNVTFGHPYQYAKDLNKSFLSLPEDAGINGWVILDFCDAVLAHKVWSTNFN